MAIGNSKLKTWRKIILIALALFIVIIIAIYNFLPSAAETIISRFAANAGFTALSLDIRKLSPFNTDIDSITIGNSDNSALKVSSLEADYSPWDITFNKTINALMIDGVEINCIYDGKSLSFPNLDFSKFMEKKPSSESSSAPYMISSIEIHNSLLKIRYKDKLFVVPFELIFHPGKSWHEGKGELDAIFRDQPIKVVFSFDKKSASFALYIKDFNLEALYGLLPEGNRLSGYLSSDIKAEVAISPFALKSLDASLHIKDLNYNNTSIPAIDISAKGSDSSFSLTSKSLSVQQSNGKTIVINEFQIPIKLDDKKLSGSTDLNIELPLSDVISKIPLEIKFAYDFIESKIHGEVKSSKLSLNLPKGEIILEDISFNSDLVKSGKNLKGQLTFDLKEVRMPAMNFTVNSIKASMPLDLSSNPDSSKEGDIAIENISYKNFNINSVKGNIQKSDSALTFSAIAPSAVLPDMLLNLNGKFGKGETGLFTTELFFHLPKYKLAIPYDAAIWFPKAKGITFQGDFEAEGFVKIAHSGIKSGAKLRITDSTINMAVKDSSAIASGVSLDLQLTDLTNLQSMPSQNFKIRKFTFGSISVENINTLFQIESLKAILFEGIGAQWCGGVITLQSIRINPGVKNYELVASCANINLAQLLGQFNIGQAEGEGTLNGSIPLVIKDDSISFGKGFLYSTPGDSGRIHIEGGTIDSFAEGVPDGTPQFDQIKLAQAALKDFEYKWVKMHLNTEDNDMIIQLQFDGKPAKPLPFVFKKEFGGFSKVDVKSPGSVFQGIRLDVNIRLPFNKLMLYNKNFQNYLKQQ